MHDPRAIIDIGSNTVRMVIYGGPPRVPVVLFNEKVTARLGKGVAENGQLSAKSMAAALSALRRFAMILRLKEVRDWQCVATAAVRDAANGPEFLGDIGALGLQPRLMTGEKEALASARGVMAAFPGASGVVADLGGGSLELIDVDGDACAHGCSLPLGSLRLARLRAPGGASFSRTVRKLLASAEWSGDHGLPLYLVGGSWRALARFAMLGDDWPLDDPHGFEMTADKALTLARSVMAGKIVQDMPRMSKSRIGSIPDAAALLAVLVREFKPSKLVFSAWGLREGLLNASLDSETKAQDPLLAGVASYCEMLGVSETSAAMVYGWTAQVCAEIGASSKALRNAATLLALASMQIEPNMRAEQAVDWALRKRWTGISSGGRAVLAMTMLANSGRETIPDNLSRLASPEELRNAISWGLAIRLCRKFSGGSPHALSESSLDAEGGLLVLTVRRPLDALLSASVERDLAQLATWLGLSPQTRVVPQEDAML